MIMLIILAALPFAWGFVQLLQGWFKESPEEKKLYKTYGIVKIAIGFITGLFLTYIYLSYSFFTQRWGGMIALVICWIILAICNAVANAKIKIDEYDNNANKEETDEETE